MDGDGSTIHPKWMEMDQRSIQDGWKWIKINVRPPGTAPRGGYPFLGIQKHKKHGCNEPLAPSENLWPPLQPPLGFFSSAVPAGHLNKTSLNASYLNRDACQSKRDRPVCLVDHQKIKGSDEGAQDKSRCLKEL